MDNCWQHLSWFLLFQLNAETLASFMSSNVPLHERIHGLLGGSCGGDETCSNATSMPSTTWLLHQYLFRAPVLPQDCLRVWLQLKLFYLNVEPLSPTLCSFPHLFWILPVPFDLSRGHEEWKVTLYAMCSLITLLRTRKFIKFEGALITGSGQRSFTICPFCR